MKIGMLKKLNYGLLSLIFRFDLWVKSTQKTQLKLSQMKKVKT
jgi:hypothetical protein